MGIRTDSKEIFDAAVNSAVTASPLISTGADVMEASHAGRNCKFERYRLLEYPTLQLEVHHGREELDGRTLYWPVVSRRSKLRLK